MEEENSTATLTTDFENLMTTASIAKSVSNLSIQETENDLNVSKPLVTKKAHNDEILVRKCDSNCKFAKHWATKLHNSLRNLDPIKNFNFIQRDILDLEYCNKCFEETYPECEAREKCKDIIKLLRDLAPHFQHIRSLLRRIYNIRSINIWLSKLDEIYYEGDYARLKKFITTAPNKVIF